MTRVVRRPAQVRRVVVQAACPVAPVTLVPRVPRGWVDVESEIKSMFRELGRVDATSLDDVVSPWRCSP
jgi:hypothetical protein